LLYALAGDIPKRVSTLFSWVAHKNHSPPERRDDYARAAGLESSLGVAIRRKIFVTKRALGTPAVRGRCVTRRNDSRVAMIQINLTQVVSN
jgi:hypothetical protein